MIFGDPVTHLISLASGVIGAAGGMSVMAYRMGKRTQKWDTAAAQVIKLWRAFEEHKEIAVIDKNCEKCNDALTKKVEEHYKRVDERVTEVKETALQTAEILRGVTEGQFKDIKDGLKGVTGAMTQMAKEFGELKGSVDTFHATFGVKT